MGNPLSGTLAHIFISNKEHIHIINSINKHQTNIIYWNRYVDDILMLFNGTSRQLNHLHKYINNINPKLKFTLEIEENKTIHFLDLSIMNIDNEHKFNIYRKKTHTDHTIDNSSNHPHNHKYAAYTHMINRLNNIPMSSQNYQDQLKTIQYIAKKNGFNPRNIIRMNENIQRKLTRSRLTTLVNNTKETPKYISWQFNRLYNKHVQKTFKQHGYTIAYKTNNKIQKYLKPKSNQTEETGIYKLTCDDCRKFYVGQTGRSFNKSFNEHIQDIKKPI